MLKFLVCAKLTENIWLIRFLLVLLQAMKEDPPLETKCRDKFLVQSVAVASDNEDSVGGPTVCFNHLNPY